MIESEKKRTVLADQLYEEIKDTFLFQVHRMQKAFVRHGNHLLQESGVDVQMEQLPVLMTLHSLGSLSQREIADVTLRDKSSILRTVTTLQRKGLVYIEQDVADKRKNIVTLTAEGMNIAIKTKSVMFRTENEVFAHFSNAERTAAIQSMREIADKLERL